MKFVLSLVRLSAMLLLVLPGVYLKNNPTVCSLQFTLSEEEIEDVNSFELPKTSHGKCFYECMMRSAGVMEEDYLIDVQKFVDSLKALKGRPFEKKRIPVAKEIMEICKGHHYLNYVSDGNNCETATFLLECSVEESKSHGWKPTQIIRMFHYIYKARLGDLLIFLPENRVLLSQFQDIFPDEDETIDETPTTM